MAANPSPDRITAAMWRLWEEFNAHHPPVLLGGIFAAKSGYHNTRAENDRRWPGDYSVEDPIDRLGPADKAAGLDLTFPDAQAADYDTIARFSRRLDAAGRNRDPRLYRSGEAILREYYGQVDSDRTVEGWDFRYDRAVSSDPSHLWHIHLSVTRKFVDDWGALSGVLAVLRGDPPEEDDVSFIGLKKGDRGTRVIELQRALLRAGHDPGPIDGEYEDRTSAAVLACRKARGSRTTSGDTILGDASFQIRGAWMQGEARPLVEAAVAQLTKAIEDASIGAGLPAAIVLDLPDTITVPLAPVDNDEQD